MRLLSIRFSRTRPLAMACGILLAACLTGCASWNPFSKASDAPANNTAATAESVQGVQTIKPDRFLGIFTPYRIDIQQGNFVSSEIMEQLRDGMKRSEGMTRDQVKFLLGTPLITDVFHADRWDYVFRLRRGNGEVVTSHVSVHFNGTKLDKVDGTILPTEKDYITLIAGNAK
jgi:outer membrane protein assembly factor BamE